MVDFFGRACFGTRRGGWGERYAPNAAKPGAPAGVNALNPENPGYACITLATTNTTTPQFRMTNFTRALS